MILRYFPPSGFPPPEPAIPHVQVDLTLQTPLTNGPSMRRLLTSMATNSGYQHQDDDILDRGEHELIIYDHDVDSTVSGPSSSSVRVCPSSSSVPPTFDIHAQDGPDRPRSSTSVARPTLDIHAKVVELTEEPEVVGNVSEDMSSFGLQSIHTRKGEYDGRTAEVASIGMTLFDLCDANMRPFVTHTLDELVWQAREAGGNMYSDHGVIGVIKTRIY